MYVCIKGSLHVCMCTVYLPGAHGGQMRAWDHLEQELQMAMSLHCRCWDLNLLPLHEQPWLLPSKPFLEFHTKCSWERPVSISVLISDQSPWTGYSTFGQSFPEVPRTLQHLPGCCASESVWLAWILILRNWCYLQGARTRGTNSFLWNWQTAFFCCLSLLMEDGINQLVAQFMQHREPHLR